MSFQDYMQKLKTVSVRIFQYRTFPTVLIGAMTVPLVLFAIGGRSPHALPQPASILFLSAITPLLALSIGVGFSQFRRKAMTLSISPKYR